MKYLKLDGVIEKTNGTDFTETEHNVILDLIIDLLESKDLELTSFSKICSSVSIKEC